MNPTRRIRRLAAVLAGLAVGLHRAIQVRVLDPYVYTREVV